MNMATVTPVRGHHCVATAMTVESEWFYDDMERQPPGKSEPLTSTRPGLAKPFLA
jgi:hypothetical protein